MFLKWCFLEKKRNKGNVAFAIYRGPGIETLLFSREMRSKLVFRNLSFLLTFDFSPILLFFPTAFSCPVWQTLRMLAPKKQFCCKCDSMDCIWSCVYEGWVEALVPYSHIQTSCINDFHTDFDFFFPSKLTFCISLTLISMVHPRSDWRLKSPLSTSLTVPLIFSDYNFISLSNHFLVIQPIFNNYRWK